jgi:hypothetical protein
MKSNVRRSLFIEQTVAEKTPPFHLEETEELRGTN